jgi:hypothetical protein
MKNVYLFHLELYNDFHGFLSPSRGGLALGDVYVVFEHKIRNCSCLMTASYPLNILIKRLPNPVGWKGSRVGGGRMDECMIECIGWFIYIVVLMNKKFLKELIAYYLWYYTDRRENDAPNNSSTIACVTFLSSRCLATIVGYIYRHTYWWKGFMKYSVRWVQVPWYTYQVS